MPAAYLWLLILMLACLITLLIYPTEEAVAPSLILKFFGMFVLTPLLLGGGLSMFLYYRYWKNKPSAADSAELRKRQ